MTANEAIELLKKHNCRCCHRDCRLCEIAVALEALKAESENADLRTQLAAAVEDMESANLCRQCAFDAQCGSENRQGWRKFGRCDNWKWRGARKER